MVRAHMTALDPGATPDEICKLNAAAKHALELLRQTAAERPRRRRNPDGGRLLTVEDLRL
jgi:hypothetical protein